MCDRGTCFALEKRLPLVTCHALLHNHQLGINTCAVTRYQLHIVSMALHLIRERTDAQEGRTLCHTALQPDVQSP
jgi:hypothetical protein